MHISNLAQWKLYQMATYILCLRPAPHVSFFSFLLLIVVVHYCSRTFVIFFLFLYRSLCGSLLHLPLSSLSLYYLNWPPRCRSSIGNMLQQEYWPQEQPTLWCQLMEDPVSTAAARSIRDPNHCSNTPSKDNHTCGNRQCDSTTGDGTRSGDQNHSRGKNNTNGGCYVLVLPGDDLLQALRLTRRAPR